MIDGYRLYDVIANGSGQFHGFACFPAGKNKVRLLSGACVLVSAISRSMRSSSFSALIWLNRRCATHGHPGPDAAMRELPSMRSCQPCGVTCPGWKLSQAFGPALFRQFLERHFAFDWRQ